MDSCYDSKNFRIDSQKDDEDISVCADNRTEIIRQATFLTESFSTSILLSCHLGPLIIWRELAGDLASAGIVIAQ